MTAALAATPPFSRVRAALTSLPGVLLVVVLLTVLCRVETTAVPWSPYFIFYGLLALLIPLWLGSVPIRATRLSGKPLWRLTAMVAVLAISIDSGIFTIAYDSLLAHLGLAQPFYSISGATNLLIQTVSVRQQISLLAAMGIFGLFVLLWAPVAEELFYRGYVYTSLKQHLPLAAAWGISVAAFWPASRTVHYLLVNLHLARPSNVGWQAGRCHRCLGLQHAPDFASSWANAVFRQPGYRWIPAAPHAHIASKTAGLTAS
jgi:membrane protease YdiL (CAAX protease family)